MVIAVIGFTVLAIGLVMVVLPGPALLVIPLALGILATEFVWARNLINKVKSKFSTKTKAKGDPILNCPAGNIKRKSSLAELFD